MQYAGILPSHKAVLAVLYNPLTPAPQPLQDFAVWVFLRARELEVNGKVGVPKDQPERVREEGDRYRHAESVWYQWLGADSDHTPQLRLSQEGD